METARTGSEGRKYHQFPIPEPANFVYSLCNPLNMKKLILSSRYTHVCIYISKFNQTFSSMQQWVTIMAFSGVRTTVKPLMSSKGLLVPSRREIKKGYNVLSLPTALQLSDLRVMPCKVNFYCFWYSATLWDHIRRPNYSIYLQWDNRVICAVQTLSLIFHLTLPFYIGQWNYTASSRIRKVLKSFCG